MLLLSVFCQCEHSVSSVSKRSCRKRKNVPAIQRILILLNCFPFSSLGLSSSLKIFSIEMLFVFPMLQ